jgi:hypothetical protein
LQWVLPLRVTVWGRNPTSRSAFDSIVQFANLAKPPSCWRMSPVRGSSHGSVMHLQVELLPLVRMTGCHGLVQLNA